jgi:uncharacterized membrane protein
MSAPPPAAAPAPLERVELLAALLLRMGVVASVLVIGAGLALSLARHPEYLGDPATLERLTAPGAAFPHALADVADELLAGRGRALVVAGLLILIGTPVLRVAVSAAVFARERDRAYAAITLAVLAVLVSSFLLGRVE